VDDHKCDYITKKQNKTLVVLEPMLAGSRIYASSYSRVSKVLRRKDPDFVESVILNIPNNQQIELELE
jgi:hypothetical protein